MHVIQVNVLVPIDPNHNRNVVVGLSLGHRDVSRPSVNHTLLLTARRAERLFYLFLWGIARYEEHARNC